MISEQVISLLNQRIGWSEALVEDFPFEISDTNLESTSGKTFQSFHQLITVENLLNVGLPESATEEIFNDTLTKIKEQAVLTVLHDAVEESTSYDPAVDYTDMLTKNAALFDKAIGYAGVVSSLELMMTSNRINTEERNLKLSAASLKLELEGYRNDAGVTVAKGIRYRYDKAILKIKSKLFPEGPTVNSDKIW